MFTSSYTIYKITQRANTYLNHFYNNIEPHYKILFVTSGGCSVVIHHCQFQVQAGDCILIPPYVIHSAVFSKINSIELVEVQFNCVSTTDELLLNSRIQDHYCFKIKEFETFLFFIRNACAHPTLTANSEALCDVTYLIDKALFQLFSPDRIDISKIKLKDESPYKLIEEMYQLLNADLQNNNNISSICSHLHVSNSYLYQCTTKVLQQSPKDLLIQYRINKAYKLLENKSLTLEKIASLLYYKNAFYFSKQFKEKTGSSPSKFRTTYYNHFK